MARGIGGWVRRHDPELNALHKAIKVAVAVPAALAIGTLWIGEAQLSTFAVFGAVAMLLFADFPGGRGARFGAYLVLVAVGALLIMLGTLSSRTTWVAVTAMAVFGFLILFSGVLSAAAAGGTRAALLAFVLPVTIPAPASEIPARLSGWGIAAVLALPLALLVWPPPDHDQLRRRAVEACRALADLLRASVPDRASAESAALTATDGLREQYHRSLARPVPLTTGSRALARLVDQLAWLRSVAVRIPPGAAASSESAGDLLRACADVLDRAADALTSTGDAGAAARTALDSTLELAAVARRHAYATVRFTVDGSLATGLGAIPPAAGHELGYTTLMVGRTVATGAAADARPLWQRLFGLHRPAAVHSTFTVARDIATGHLSRRSVWFQNSLRGAAGLALAVLLARVTDVGHGFWVVLGTMSVLRTSALTTSATAARALMGTTVGFLLGAGLVLVLGTDPNPLWIVLPILALLAGFAPEAISFLAGQAAFTLLVVVLFNIIQPVGWTVGLVRVEDVALGCAAGLICGILLWPHGASAAIARALADGYRSAADALTAAVRRAEGEVDLPTACSAAAEAGRRLDDALREYLAERGGRPVPVSQLTTAAAGADRLRLVAEAVGAMPATDGRAVPPGPAEALDGGGRAVTDWYRAVAGVFERLAATPSSTGGSAPRLPTGVTADVEHAVLEAIAATGRDRDAARDVWRASLYLDDAALLSDRLGPCLRVLTGADRLPDLAPLATR